ncbi:MAG: beta-propeller domain-containing protein [Clostridia bacterium]
MKKSRWIIGLLGTLIVAALSFPMLTIDSYANSAKTVPSDTTSPAATLPKVGSVDKLARLMNKVYERESKRMLMKGTVQFGAMEMSGGSAPVMAAPAAAEAADSSAANSYSATNVQVQGVDEADVLKTDGTYLYHAANNQVVISRAYPASDMKVIKQLTFEQDRFMPTELYVDEQHLVVIGMKEMAPYQKRAIQAGYYYNPQSVRAYVYDISDKGNITKLRELDLDGYYVASRKIGQSLYLVTSKAINYYAMQETKQKEEELKQLPFYRDSSSSDEYKPISLEDTRYFPDRIDPSYLLVGAVDLSSKKAMHVSSFLGNGETVYASPNNLYVTVTKWDDTPVTAKPAVSSFRAPEPPLAHSSIYKFALKDGRMDYTGKGEVPGTILNQFSLDEHNGDLRIATTSGDMWRTDEHTSKNNLYVLNKNLSIKGKLEGIAPGERIYSARFMGDRAYMVTFKKVDPLFVIDLKQPDAPRILGALKIPGYSDYLHPYDENHIIGFGKDTIEAKQGSGNFAWYQGMKVALFDVTDVAHPKEKFVEIIGDRGTDSELLHNHKALLFSREKNLLAFPVTEMKISAERREPNAFDEFPAYGEFSFQGAYIYQLDLEKGFQLRKRITHLSAEQVKKAGYEWYNSNDNIQRILYINDVLYTYSPSKVKAFDLTSLKEKSELVFPQ